METLPDPQVGSDKRGLFHTLNSAIIKIIISTTVKLMRIFPFLESAIVSV